MQLNHYTNNVIGPVANRISSGSFSIDGIRFELDKNEGTKTLHGGSHGISELDWNIVSKGENYIHFSINIEHGHMGFPGPSQFDVIYRLNLSALEVELRAISPRVNAFNLTSHCYFNLNGEGSIENHNLQILADKYLPVDD